jgi:ubiquinone/menaquinone biosynthesis C-methylase UbiE
MTETYYDAISEGYDELYADEQIKKMNIIKKHMNINSNSTILDIGCGTGISTDFNCKCIGIDSSNKLISIAKRKDKNPSHEFIVSKAEDINRLNFKNNSFDYILCVSMIHHIINLEKFLNDIQQLSRKYIITILKNLKRKEKIINTIEQYLKISKIINEDKDIILICVKK